MSETIGFIGGGQMGEALIKGLLSAGKYKSNEIIVVEPVQSRQDYLKSTYSVSTVSSVETILQECPILLLAVKPQIMATVLKGLRDHITSHHLLITIAAGLPIAFYKKHLKSDSCKVVRVMPNTPALVMEGASALCGCAEVNDDDLNTAREILDSVGTTVLLDEHLMDAVTGLSGSGPGYVFTFIEAMIDAGVQNGLPRETAQMLATQTLLGSVKLMQETEEHPAVLRGRVTSPGGTTIAGLHVMEQQGLRGTIMDAIRAATNRSIELGKKV